MAWTTPWTWTTSELVTAARMNTHVRDNLNFLATAVSDTDSGSRTFTNTGYLDLDALTGGAGTFDALIATVDTGTNALVSFTAEIGNATAGQFTAVSYKISGATTVGAADTWAIVRNSAGVPSPNALSRTRVHTGLTAGSNTFELQAKVGGGTGAIDRADLVVMPLP